MNQHNLHIATLSTIRGMIGRLLGIVSRDKGGRMIKVGDLVYPASPDQEEYFDLKKLGSPPWEVIWVEGNGIEDNIVRLYGGKGFFAFRFKVVDTKPRCEVCGHKAHEKR